MDYEGQARVTWLSILMSGEETELASLVTDVVWEQSDSEIYPGVGGPGGRVKRAPKITISNVPNGIGGATHFRVTLNEEVYQGEAANCNIGKNSEGVKCIQYITFMRGIK